MAVPVPGKNNAYVIEERRRKVYKLWTQGVPETKIAEALGVHRNTVCSDIKALREAHRERVAAIDAYTEIGDHDRFLTEMERLAMYEYSQSQDTTTMVDVPVFRDGVAVLRPDGKPVMQKEKRIVQSQSAARHKFLELAMKARERRMEYQLDTGVVPRTPEKVDLGLFNIDGVDIRKVTPEMLEELQKKLVAKIMAQGLLPPGESE